MTSAALETAGALASPTAEISPRAIRVGVLALQGDFAAHALRLRDLGAAVREVRTPAQLGGLDALIVPGGESTTMLKFLARDGFFEALQDFGRARPIFGTCAGAILLARQVLNPPQPGLNLIDIDVERNAYGRQADSFIARAESPALGELEAVFIRAPRIRRAGSQVEILATREGEPILVRQGLCVAATFHPELCADPTVHAWFLRHAAAAVADR